MQLAAALNIGWGIAAVRDPVFAPRGWTMLTLSAVLGRHIQLHTGAGVLGLFD